MTNAPNNPPILDLPKIYPTDNWIMNQAPLMAMTNQRLLEVVSIFGAIAQCWSRSRPAGLRQLLDGEAKPRRPDRPDVISLIGMKRVLGDAEMLRQLMLIEPEAVTGHSIESTTAFLGMLQINPLLTYEIVTNQDKLTGMSYGDLAEVWLIVVAISQASIGRDEGVANKIKSYGQVHMLSGRARKEALITMGALRGVLDNEAMMQLLSELYPGVFLADRITLTRRFCQAVYDKTAC